MRLSILIAAFGVLSILLFTFHWMFKMMHWPFAPELKYGAFGLAAIGLVLLGIDQLLLNKRNNKDEGQNDLED